MKFIILFLLISCGVQEKENSFQAHHHLTGNLTIKNHHPFIFKTEDLGADQVFRRFLTSSRKSPFNDPEIQIIKFQEDIEILSKDHILSFSLNIDQDPLLYNLFLWREGVEERIPSSQFSLSREIFERIIRGDALLYIKYKFNLYRGDLIYDGERAYYAKSFQPPDSLRISLEEIFSGEDSHQKQWFHTENPFGEVIFVHTTLSKLKEEFFKLYQRRDYELKRVDGRPQGSLALKEGLHFLKVTANQEMNHITKRGSPSMNCRPQNVIVSKSTRVPHADEIAQSLSLASENILKELYSSSSTEVWFSTETLKETNLPLNSPGPETFFHERKCDRKVLRNFEAKLRLKVETYVEKDLR